MKCEENLWDCVEREAAQYGVPRMELWRRVVQAHRDGTLSLQFPSGRVEGHGPLWHDWFDDFYNAIMRDNDPQSFGAPKFLRSIPIEGSNLKAWFAEALHGTKPRRRQGAKPTMRDKVREHIKLRYPNGTPPGVPDKTIADAVGCSERTVRRARGRS